MTDAVDGGDPDGRPGADDDAVAASDASWLSDDGVVLAFAGAASLLAAATAHRRGQSPAVVGPALVAGGVAAVAVGLDVATDRVAGTPVEVAVGGAALAGALAALGWSHWVNAATLGTAAALVLWRVVDVERRGAER